LKDTNEVSFNFSWLCWNEVDTQVDGGIYIPMHLSSDITQHNLLDILQKPNSWNRRHCRMFDQVHNISPLAQKWKDAWPANVAKSWEVIGKFSSDLTNSISFWKQHPDLYLKFRCTRRKESTQGLNNLSEINRDLNSRSRKPSDKTEPPPYSTINMIRRQES